jgi:outer membrane protein OmpA-like peptidoglycan-associated protein
MMEGLMIYSRIAFALVCIGSLVTGGALLGAQAQPALGGLTTTESAIRAALTNGIRTRGLVAPATSPERLQEDRFIEELRTRSTRSLTVVEREKVIEIARKRPNIDLEIQFEYNSTVVGPAAAPTLVALGRVLSGDEFKGTVFLINGHTDAKGGDAYNQGLSERRAEAVKRLLIEQFGLPTSTLIAIGYGKTQLKNAADPTAAENRRVQIVNTEVK